MSSLWSPLYIQSTLRAAVQQAGEELREHINKQLTSFVTEAVSGLANIRQTIVGVSERTDALDERADELQGVVERLMDSNNLLVQRVEALEAQVRAHDNSMYLTEAAVRELASKAR